MAFAAVRNRGLDADTATGVARAVLLKLLERRPSFELDRILGAFKGYANTFVGYAIIDLSRRAKARATVSDDVLKAVPVQEGRAT